MKWHDDETNLDNVAYSAIVDKKILNPRCCNDPKIHIHAHRGCFSSRNSNRGGIWIWCSNCGAFSHMDGITIPSDWDNNSDVDFSKVAAVPNYLDMISDSIDKHLSEYIRISR